MSFFTTDPLGSRTRFKSRTFENMAVLAVMFIPVMMFLSWQTSILFRGILPLLMVDAVALGVVYHLYTLWNKRPIRLRCPGCKKIILSNTPWVCGFCKAQNRNANEYPFVHQCGHCHDEAKAYKCHHREDGTYCGTLVFLSDDKDERNFAYCINTSGTEEADDKHAEKVKRNQRKKQSKQDKIEMAKLDEELRHIKDRLKKKNPAEAQTEVCDQEYQGLMGIREYCRKKRTEVATLYKEEPDLLREANEAIDAIERTHC